MYLIIDIGNSRVKYYYQKKSFFSVDDLKSFIGKASDDQVNIDIMVISTVPESNQIEIDKLSEFLTINKVEIFDPMKSELKNIYPGIGPDRVAKTISALKQFPGKDIILMDFGTATTMTIANKNFEYLGGYISLGFKSSLEALASETACLPDLAKLDLNDAKNPTEKAILEGAYKAHLGLVREWMKSARKLAPDAYSVCTGGLGKFFEEEFDYFDISIFT